MEIIGAIAAGISIIIFVFQGIKLFYYRNRKKAFLKNLREKYQKYKDYYDIKFIQECETKKKDEERNSFSISELLNTQRKLHIMGKPGAGKTSTLLKLILLISQKQIKLKKIPIYIEFGTESLLEKTRNYLHINGYIKDINKRDQNWLKNQLVKGKFLFLIDDIHKIKTDNETYRHLKELLEFDKNIFILMSRDYFETPLVGFETYYVNSLSIDDMKNILKIYLEENKIGLTIQQMSFNKQLLTLYSTPQMLYYLSIVLSDSERLPSNKSFLFQKFFDLRLKKETEQYGEFRETITLQRKIILSTIAYHMFQQTDDYFNISYDFVLLKTQEELLKLKNSGQDVESGEAFLDNLFRYGLLIRNGDEIHFEHDQWQEYFMAIYIFKNDHHLDSILSLQSFREITFFLAGLHTYRGNEDQKTKCNEFLHSLLVLDYIQFGHCLENYHEFQSIGDLEEHYKDYKITESYFRDRYLEFLNYYKLIVDFHFKNLKKQFFPRTIGDIGIVVQFQTKRFGFWYGFRKINNRNEEIIIIPKKESQNDDNNLTEFYELGVQDGIKSNGREPVIYELPIIAAYREVLDQLSKLIEKKELIPPQDIFQEKFLYNLNAFRDRIYLEQDIQNQTVNEIKIGFDKYKLEQSIEIQQRKNNSYNRREIKREVNELYEKGSEVPQLQRSTTHYFSSNMINDVELERDFLEYRKIFQLADNDRIKHFLKPFPIDTHWFDYNSYPKLEDTQKDLVLSWFVEYYMFFYKNYFELLDINFPTLKDKFKTYSKLPILVVLHSNGREYIYQEVEFQTEPYKVISLQEESIEEFEKKNNLTRWLKGYTWVTRVERNKKMLTEDVYKIIESEFKSFRISRW